jgi:hypothetical protein
MAELPDDLIRAFGDDVLDAPDQAAYLLLTGDEDGAPRISMLSVGEVLVLDPRTLRVALWPGTHTAANLGRGGTALFGAISPGSVTYVRLRPVRLTAPAHLECFELTVTDVRADVHEGMPVTSGITFRAEDPSVATTWRDQRALLAAL